MHQVDEGPAVIRRTPELQLLRGVRGKRQQVRALRPVGGAGVGPFMAAASAVSRQACQYLQLGMRQLLQYLVVFQCEQSLLPGPCVVRVCGLRGIRPQGAGEHAHRYEI